MEEEIWKPVVGYDGLYVVSSVGRVRSLERVIMKSNGCRMTVKTIILKPSSDHHGYLFVYICGKDKPKRKYIHVLVAKAFIPNYDNKPCVDHINGDPRDNRVENLRWCTHKENCNFDLARKRKSIAHTGKFGRDSSRYKTVLQYKKDGTFIRSFCGAREAGRELHLNPSNISSVCRGDRMYAGGYIWKYNNIK